MLSNIQSFRIVVKRQDTAAMCMKELNGDQPDETKPHYRDGFTQCWLRQSNALQRNGTNHGKGGFVVGYGVWDLGAQIDRHRNRLGVLAVRRDAITGREPRNTPAYIKHDTDIAVAKRQWLVEFTRHRLKRGGKTVCTNLVKHLPDLIRLLSRFSDQPCLTEVHKHPLCASGDERSRGADQHMPVPWRGARHFGYLRRACFQMLKYLLHLDAKGCKNNLRFSSIVSTSINRLSAKRKALVRICACSAGFIADIR